MDRASWHEQVLLWHNRPLSTLLMKAVARSQPGARLPFIGYVVNSPDLAVQLLNHPCFRSTGHGSMDELITPLVGPNALFNVDGLPHRHMRMQLMQVFARSNVERLVAAAAEGVMCEMRQELQRGGAVDLTAYARRLVGRSISQALGLRVRSEAVYGEVEALAHRMTSLLGLQHLSPSAQDVRRAGILYRRLLDLARDSYGPRPPGEPATVISVLQEAGMSFEEAAGTLAVVLLAGTETALAALPRIAALLIDSGQIDQLATHRELLTNAYVEGLRLVVPTHVIIRSVAQHTLLGRMEFEQNERVIVLLYNALREPGYFPNQERFDRERSVEPRFKHLCFGAGPHFCLGFGLAHCEIDIFIRALLDLPGRLHIVSRRYPRDLTFPSYASLKVRLSPSS